MAGENGVPEMLDFNPRSHEGSDGNVNKYIPFYWEFQSTLPRGERLVFYRDKLPKFHFNPRSHEGSDQAEPMATISETDFNPRSHEGSDRLATGDFDGYV